MHKTTYERKFITSKCNEIWSTDGSKYPMAAENCISHLFWIYIIEKLWPLIYQLQQILNKQRWRWKNI